MTSKCIICGYLRVGETAKVIAHTRVPQTERAYGVQCMLEIIRQPLIVSEFWIAESRIDYNTILASASRAEG